MNLCSMEINFISFYVRYLKKYEIKQRLNERNVCSEFETSSSQTNIRYKF